MLALSLSPGNKIHLLGIGTIHLQEWDHRHMLIAFDFPRAVQIQRDDAIKKKDFTKDDKLKLLRAIAGDDFNITPK